jgi:hypothetical protein
MMLNPSQANPTQAGFGPAGYGVGAGFGQPAFGGAQQPFGGIQQPFGGIQQQFTPLAAFGGAGLGQMQPQAPLGGQQFGQQFGQQAGFAQAQIGGPIEDIADDIAERVSNEIADQAATAAATMYLQQFPGGNVQPLSSLNIKRWLHQARVTDAVRDTVKQGAHQLCRQAIGQVHNLLQSQQQQQPIAALGQQPSGQWGFGQQMQPGLAAYGGAQQPFQQQQTAAQLAPVVASILSSMAAQSQPYWLAQTGALGRQYY